MNAERGATLVIDAEHPWPGLMPFTENAQAFFHGRDIEADELARLIRRETLTVLFGQSGLGKSSLLNAGLFPRLRAEDFLPIYIRLDVAESAPPFREQVAAAIAADAAAHRVEAPPARPDETLWAYFHRRDADFWTARNRLLTPVLVFDQFEEIFTLGRHGEALEGRCSRLLDELADLVENRMPAAVARQVEAHPERGAELDYSRRGYKVVFSFREDYLPDFEGLRPQIRSIMQNRMRLTRMTGEQAYAAVLKAGGHLMGTDVAEHVVRFVAAPRSGQNQRELMRLQVEPALLSVVCHELNNQRLRAGAARISADVLREGAPHQIIEDFYNTSLRDLDPNVRIFVEDQLLTEAGFRDSYPLDDAQTRCGVALDDINRLVERRLLRIEERSGILRVELTHDVLNDVARASRDQRNARRAEEERRATEARRRAQTRRLMLFSGGAVASAVAVAAVFAVLLKDARDERRRLIETQSYVWLARANGAAEQGASGEPYAMLAEALRLDPGNRAAVMRATALIEQRRHAVQLEQTPVSGRARVAWLGDEEYAVFSPGRVALRRPGHAGVDVLEAQLPPVEAAPARLTRRPEPALSGVAFPAEANLVAPAGRGHAKLPRQGLFAYHPEAGAISLIGPEGMLQLVEARAGAPVGRPVQLTGTPREILVSARAAWVAAEMETGEIVLASLDGKAWHRHAAARRPENGKVLAAITDDGTLLRRRATGYDMLRRGDTVASRTLQPRFINGPAVASPDGKVLAIGTDTRLMLWSVADDQDFAMLEDAPIRDVTFSPDGRRLAVALTSRMLRIWTLETRREVGNGLAHASQILCVRFVPGSNLVASGSADGTVRIWDPDTGRSALDALVHPDPIADIAVRPSGGELVAMTFGEELYAWRWSKEAPERMDGALLASSADGSFLALAGSPTQPGVSVMRWNDAQTAYVPSRRLGSGPAMSAAFAPDGRHLAIGWGDGGLSLVDPAGETAIEVVAPDRTVTALAYSASGSVLAATERSGTVRLFDGARIDMGAPVLAHGGAVRAVEFSRDEALALTTQRSRLRLWRARGGQHLADVDLPDNEHLVRAVFTADASHLVVIFDRRAVRVALEVGADGRLTPGSFERGEQLSLGDFKVWSAMASPSRARVALGSVDGRARMLDLSAWRLVGETMKHDDTVLGLAFSADETRLLTWSRDRTVSVWDAASGYPVSDAIEIRFDEPALAGFGPAGMVVASSGTQTFANRVGAPGFVRAPAWLPELLEAVGGTRIDPQGGVERIRDRLGRLRRLADSQDSAAPAYWYPKFVASGTDAASAVASREARQ